ncbi:hypothetical protein ACFYP4_13765 [Streptomyces sp. NPDC005551]|uniref:hypothetical protein n=1 Tax=Streptomyces sp. NPDC005551 TaxID=3364725 RepID=UPI0036ADD51E
MPTDEQLAVDLIGRVAHGRAATSMRALPFDGEPFDPVHLAIEPRFATVHTTDGALERRFQHML